MLNNEMKTIEEINRLTVKKILSEKKVPNFLVENSIENISKEDLIAGIDIIGNFLEKSILSQNNLSVPETRISFANLVRKL